MKAYETPDVTEVGSLEELTQGDTSGSLTDAAFPELTPKKDLTFTG